MKGEIDFSRLKNENISKESSLKSNRFVEKNAQNRPLRKTQCKASLESLLFRSCPIKKSLDFQALFQWQRIHSATKPHRSTRAQRAPKETLLQQKLQQN